MDSKDCLALRYLNFLDTHNFWMGREVASQWSRPEEAESLSAVER